MTPTREDVHLAPFRAFGNALLGHPAIAALTRLAERIAKRARVR